MRYLIEAGIVLVGEDLEIRRNASLYIEDGKIESIGLSGFSAGSNVKKINFRRGIIMPSLVNAHIHTADVGFEEVGWDLDIDSVVGEPYGLKYTLLNKYKERISDFIERSLRLSLLSGSLVLNDFREGGLDGILKALAASSKFREIVYLPSYMPDIRSVYRDPGAFTRDLKEISRYTKWIALSSPHYYNKDFLEKIDDLAESLGVWILSHVAETRDVREEKDFELIRDLRRLRAVIHGVYLSHEDLLELRDKGVNLILCPRSNMWFGSGLIDLNKIISSGVRLGLGTDNAGWIKPDMWREMEYLVNIARLQSAALDPREILKIATVYNAEIFGIKNIIDEEREAFFIGLSSEWINIESSGNIYLSIIKRGGPESLRIIARNTFLRIF